MEILKVRNIISDTMNSADQTWNKNECSTEIQINREYPAIKTQRRKGFKIWNHYKKYMVDG